MKRCVSNQTVWAFIIFLLGRLLKMLCFMWIYSSVSVTEELKINKRHKFVMSVVNERVKYLQNTIFRLLKFSIDHFLCIYCDLRSWARWNVHCEFDKMFEVIICSRQAETKNDVNICMWVFGGLVGGGIEIGAYVYNC